VSDDDHLSLDELAELDEGLLSQEREDAARAHLAGCSQCQDHAAAIDAVRVRLSELPTAAMPEDVAARLERALAAEPALTGDGSETTKATDATGTAPGTDWTGSSATIIPNVTDLRTHRSRWGRPTMAASAVAAALVLGGVAIVLGVHGSGSGSSSGSESAGASGGVEPNAADAPVGPNPTGGSFATASTGRTYTAANLATLIPSLVKAPATGSQQLGSGSGTTAKGNSDTVSSPALVPSPTVSPLASAPASSSVNGVPAPSAAQPPGSPTYDFSQPAAHGPILPALRAIAASKSRLLQCAAAVSGSPGSVPEVIDFGRWTGGTLHNAPSIFLVFNGPRPSTVAVYVVGPTCDPNALRNYSVVPLAP
jgi:hypothetical protein